MRAQVAIVDDDQIIVEWVRDRLSELPDCTVVGEFNDGKACIDYLRKNPATLVILDLGMKGGLHGLEAGPQIRELRPEIKILVLSQFDGYLPQVQGWADGYLLKREAPAKLGKAIEKLLHGRQFVSHAVRNSTDAQAVALFRSLRQSEAAVVKAVMANRTPIEIASDLQIQPSTVYKHLQNIYNKLGLKGEQRSTAGLIRMAKSANISPSA